MDWRKLRFGVVVGLIIGGTVALAVWLTGVNQPRDDHGVPAIVAWAGEQSRDTLVCLAKTLEQRAESYGLEGGFEFRVKDGAVPRGRNGGTFLLICRTDRQDRLRRASDGVADSLLHGHQAARLPWHVSGGQDELQLAVWYRNPLLVPLQEQAEAERQGDVQHHEDEKALTEPKARSRVEPGHLGQLSYG